MREMILMQLYVEQRDFVDAHLFSTWVDQVGSSLPRRQQG